MARIGPNPIGILSAFLVVAGAATLPLAAMAQAADQGALQEVIVTAQKRSANFAG